MIIDEDENGEVCVPWEENYNSGLVFGLNSVEKMCSKHNNPESCAYKACTVEGSFVIKIFDFVFTEGLSIDASFSHDNAQCRKRPMVSFSKNNYDQNDC